MVNPFTSSASGNLAMIMPPETDVAPNAISGWDWVCMKISGPGYAKSTFGQDLQNISTYDYMMNLSYSNWSTS